MTLTKNSPATPTMMRIARGMSRRGCSASSASVLTASKPRNDSARIAAPDAIAPASIPGDRNGVIEKCAPFAPSTMFLIVSPTNATATTTWMTTRITLTLAAIRTPIRLSAVQTTMVDRIHTHDGTSGNAAVM